MEYKTLKSNQYITKDYRFVIHVTDGESPEEEQLKDKWKTLK